MFRGVGRQEGERSSLSSSIGMIMRPLWPSKASSQSWLSMIQSACHGSVHSARALVFVEHLPWARLFAYQESVRILQWRRQGESHSQVLGEEGVHRVSAPSTGWWLDRGPGGKESFILRAAWAAILEQEQRGGISKAGVERLGGEWPDRQPA